MFELYIVVYTFKTCLHLNLDLFTVLTIAKRLMFIAFLLISIVVDKFQTKNILKPKIKNCVQIKSKAKRKKIFLLKKQCKCKSN